MQISRQEFCFVPFFSLENTSTIILITPFFRKVKAGVHPNMASEEREESLSNHSINGPQRESKLELFGFDSLVNILGLKR